MLSAAERAYVDALGLSRRERDVLAYAVLEQSQKEIATLLELSFHTVKSHARAIAFKAKAKSLAEIASTIRARCRVASAGDGG